MIFNTGFNPISSNNGWNAGNFGNMGFGGNSAIPGLSMPSFGSNMANTSQNQRANILQIRTGVENLRTSLNNMLGIGRNTSSPFGAGSPVSANNDQLAVTGFDANRLRNSGAQNFSVDVTRVAQAQRNEGTSLSATALASESGFSVGNQQMTISLGGRNFDINFSVSATDTNADVQTRIANAVNSRNLGVTASVSRDSAAGTSALVLSSSETGVAAAGRPNFTVSGGAALGVGNITQQAQDAEFRVNRGFTGALQTSRSNDVNLGFGISAQLRETGNVRVNMERNEGAQIDSMRDMVNNFNTLLERAQDNAGGSRLEQQLTGMMRAFSTSLANVGITANRHGFMQIDENRMRTAAESGALERFVGDGGPGGNFGFVNRLSRTVDNAIRNPANMMNNQANNRQSTHRIQQMNRLMNTGMLFSTWF